MLLPRQTPVRGGEDGKNRRAPRDAFSSLEICRGLGIPVFLIRIPRSPGAEILLSRLEVALPIQSSPQEIAACVGTENEGRGIASSGPASTKPRRRISLESSPVFWATASNRSESLMGSRSPEKWEMGNGKHTGTPAANAAGRKKGNTPGSQRGGRGGCRKDCPQGRLIDRAGDHGAKRLRRQARPVSYPNPSPCPRSPGLSRPSAG
jgi:hypothetical protein